MVQVVIAARGGIEAKSRCAGVLDGPGRAALTAAMLDDMLSAVARCPDISTTWVVTPTADLAGLARRHGVKVVIQDRPEGLNPAFAQAVAEVSDSAPYDPIALMPGDLPLLAPDDLAAAARLVRTHAVVLAPALDGGTGLLAFRAGVDLAPGFGPDSFRRHSAAAQYHGLTVGVVVARSLSYDIDRPEDLKYLAELGRESVTRHFLRTYRQVQPRP
jgi:2-phospho-L-lactate guanylyltransferase